MLMLFSVFVVFVFFGDWVRPSMVLNSRLNLYAKVYQRRSVLKRFYTVLVSVKMR